MAKFDIHNHVDVKRAISPAAAVTDNTAWVSEVLDTRGYGAVELVINIGALADADATFTVLIEDSDTSGSGYAAVADAELLGTEALAGFTFADDNKLRKIGYIGNKRYVRATITPANNSGNAFVSANWLLGMPELAPTANPPV